MKQRAFLAIGTIVLCAGLLAGCGKVTKSVEINYGETYKIEDEKLEGKENLTWESADAEIVEVADDGTVTAKAPGKAKVAIKENGKSVGEYTFNVSIEEMRQELRELIKFLVDGVEGQKPVYTALADPVLEQTEGKALDSGYDFGEYRERVNRYIMEHRSDTLAIHKLTQNIPLSRGDYTELEHIFTCELGSKEDYAREFRDTPFGLLVRKVAKLDHDAAMQAFSKFINDESLNAKQIAFVQKVIHYIEQNGYVESKAVLMKPPFDQPILFTRLFDGKTGSELMDTINSVKENATHVTA